MKGAATTGIIQSPATVTPAAPVKEKRQLLGKAIRGGELAAPYSFVASHRSHSFGIDEWESINEATTKSV